MLKPAESSVALSPLIANRWSPRSFDAVAEISDTDIAAILEAGRWSPSTSNQQPWRFIVAKRGDSHFENLTKNFAGFNATWAPSASALILVVAVTTNEDGSVRPFALPDNYSQTAILVLGKQAPAEHLDNEALLEREKAPRVRLPLAEIVIAGLPAA